MSNFFHRLTQLYEKEGFKSLNDFALNGLKYSSSEKLNRLKKPNTSPSYEIITDISNKFDVDLNWLIGGKQETILTTGNVNVITEPSVNYENLKFIPLIPLNAMAGYANDPTTILELDCEKFLIPTFRGADFLIQVKGNSMQPRYNSGDIVACKKLSIHDVFFQWGKVYVLDTDQGPLVKRIQQGPDDEHILVVSDNSELYKPFSLHLSKINAIAIVMGIIRLV
jgi:repressor LexA